MIHPAYFFLILLYQLIGEAIHHWLALPIPGAIIGMLLLLLSLQIKKPGQALTDTADTLIRYLPLFFVPAGVGIIAHTQEVFDNLAPLLAALLIGTPIGFIATLFLLRRLSLVGPGEENASKKPINSP